MSQSRNYSRGNVVYEVPNPATVLEQQEKTTNNTMQSVALEAKSSSAIQEVNHIL